MRPAPPRQVKGVIANFFLREMIWASYSAIRPLGHPALADRSAPFMILPKWNTTQGVHVCSFEQHGNLQRFHKFAMKMRTRAAHIRQDRVEGADSPLIHFIHYFGRRIAGILMYVIDTAGSAGSGSAQTIKRCSGTGFDHSCIKSMILYMRRVFTCALKGSSLGCISRLRVGMRC